MDETELAWAAGFFDGEGSTSVRTNGNRVYPLVSIGQKFPEVLNRFKNAVGGRGNLHRSNDTRYNPPHPLYQLQFHNRQAIDVLKLLMPHLSAIKCEQAKKVLDTIADFNKAHPSKRPGSGRKPKEFST